MTSPNSPGSDGGGGGGYRTAQTDDGSWSCERVTHVSVFVVYRLPFGIPKLYDQSRLGNIVNVTRNAPWRNRGGKPSLSSENRHRRSLIYQLPRSLSSGLFTARGDSVVTAVAVTRSEVAVR